MKRVLCTIAVMLATSAAGRAQSLEDLNIQIHGYATQGFLYTTNSNNAFGADTSDGSPMWTETVVNISAQPTPKLRIAIQTRYELLGIFANQITLDYVSADYKESDLFGIRFGKVKVPSGLYNEISDVDPSYLFALLPQSVYPITSRNGQLSLYGGVVYGNVALPSKLGKLEYRAWGGEVTLPTNDGYIVPQEEAGIASVDGISYTTVGAALHWKTPLPGLMVGTSARKINTQSGGITIGALAGNELVPPLYEPAFFGRYEKKRLSVSAEYDRLAGKFQLQFPGPPAAYNYFNRHGQYVMATYKVSEKFSVGAYNSEYFNRAAPLGPGRYSKDWTIAGRYDFSQFVYAKAEEHFLEGTGEDFENDVNINGLKPSTKLTVLKVGVSF